jgi:hypothetical protein
VLNYSSNVLNIHSIGLAVNESKVLIVATRNVAPILKIPIVTKLVLQLGNHFSGNFIDLETVLEIVKKSLSLLNLNILLLNESLLF